MIAAIIKILTGGLVDKVVDLAKSYFVDKAISEAQFEAEVEKAKVDAEARAITAFTESVHATIRTSPAIQRAYAATLFLQIVVLLWYQLGAPAYLVITGTPWPSPGVELEWAYLLVGAMVGAGPLIMRR
jgi:hypothetical protein